MEATIETQAVNRAKVAKPLLWIAIVSIVMLFMGLTSAYIVRQAEGDWLEFDLPTSTYISTAIIILSSISMWWSQKNAKTQNEKGLKNGLLVTLFLGIAFVISQFIVWNDLVKGGIYFAGAQANAAGSYLYVLSGLHLAHIIGGIIALLVTTYNAYQSKYSAGNTLGVELCATYWHFLDILWIYLLLFLLFIR